VEAGEQAIVRGVLAAPVAGVDLVTGVAVEHRGKETMVALALVHLVIPVAVAVEKVRLAQMRVAVLAVMVALVKQ
tara:strand:+ start:333 stop:557 length:225 start_codon:yes stop_codon:yes gene_type:complete